MSDTPDKTDLPESPKQEQAPKPQPPKVTAPVKSVKQKDPRRVAAGKKLGAISKAAKEKKARERFMAEGQEIACDRLSNAYLFGLGALGLGLGYCLMRNRDAPAEETPKDEPKVVNREKRSASPPPSTSRLDNFD